MGTKRTATERERAGSRGLVFRATHDAFFRPIAAPAHSGIATISPPARVASAGMIESAE
jgi:hypothetical protein